MSADGSITMFWGDDEYKFRLAIGEFRQLQEAINGRRILLGAQPIGPATLLNMLRINDGWPDDLRDILRLGLVGGGMKEAVVHRKMAVHFKEPFFEHCRPAFAIVAAALVGPPDDQLSKKKTVTTETSQSSSPPSTEPAPQ